MFLTRFTSVPGSSAGQPAARVLHVEAVSSPYVKEQPRRGTPGMNPPQLGLLSTVEGPVCSREWWWMEPVLARMGRVFQYSTRHSMKSTAPQELTFLSESVLRERTLPVLGWGCSFLPGCKNEPKKITALKKMPDDGSGFAEILQTPSLRSVRQ